MSDYLLLGPMLLQGFELPQNIRWGGSQKLAIHRLPGGERVIDSLGRDDADISWSGVFAGQDGTLRARALDLMRADGLVWPLTWSTFFFSVVIKSLAVDYGKGNWLPYRLTCTVVRDEAAALVSEVLSLAGRVLGDLSSAADLRTGMDLSGALIDASVAGATNLGTTTNAQAKSSLSATNLVVDGNIQTQQAALLSVSPTTATGLNAGAVAAGNLAALTAARGYLRRALANLAGATL